MKKKITILFLLLVVLSLFFITKSVFAEERSTVITTKIDPYYVVTIPLDIKVNYNAESTDFGSIVLDKAQLEPNKCVKVTLSSDNKLDNKADANKTIPYSIYKKDSNTVFSSISLVTPNERCPLSIKINKNEWNNAYAGDYEDTVTFHIQYTNK